MGHLLKIDAGGKRFSNDESRLRRQPPPPPENERGGTSLNGWVSKKSTLTQNTTNRAFSSQNDFYSFQNTRLF